MRPDHSKRMGNFEVHVRKVWIARKKLRKELKLLTGASVAISDSGTDCIRTGNNSSLLKMAKSLAKSYPSVWQETMK